MLAVTERDRQLGQALADFRGDMSQQQLADRMRQYGWKWSQATVWAVEKGDRPLRLFEAKDVAAILGVQLGDLMDSGDAADRLRKKLALVESQIDRIDPRLRDLRSTATGLRRRIRELENAEARAAGFSAHAIKKARIGIDALTPEEQQALAEGPHVAIREGGDSAEGSRYGEMQVYRTAEGELRGRLFDSTGTHVRDVPITQDANGGITFTMPGAVEAASDSQDEDFDFLVNPRVRQGADEDRPASG